ncbi:hypothetical protein SteCoe_33833 [Stentor coeruleus]|uniref:Bile salt export pump n=1 Tax=Stentor coeruleus TaxID=5963 RepID=A0A1R2AVX3_9CILI|nr:hypothetical protein SteCoe_33833 [Stentor coeruleus]
MPERLQNPQEKSDDKNQDKDLETAAFLKPQEMETGTRASFSVMYQYATRKDFILIVIGLITNVIFSCLPVVLVIKIGDVIDIMSNFNGDFDNFYNEERETAIIQFILGIVTVILSWIAVSTFIKLGSRQGLYWKRAYFNAVINKPITWFDKHNPAELGSAIDMDCNAIEHALGEKIMLVMSSLIFFIASWILAFIISIELSCIALCMLPFQLGAAFIVEKASVEASIESQEKYKVAGGIAEECLEGVKTVASCNAQENRARHYQMELEPLKKSTTLMGILHGFGWAVFFVVLFAFSGILFYISAYLMVEKPEIWGMTSSIEAKEVVMIFFATAMSSFYLGTAVPCVQFIEAGRVAAARVDRIIKKSKKWDGNKRIIRLKGQVDIEDAYFNYPSNPQINILQGISLSVKPGDSLALVGETGSGKSTIIQLIEGFYYPTSGVVKIDGLDIREYDLSTIRELIALVNQEPILFNCSIKENIKMGYVYALDKEVEAAAKEAEANEFIDSLPEKYDTWVGLKGSQLSGGQKQRIAIARAMIKKPKILLLDEATSALDMNTEKKIQVTLDKVMKGRTTIIVAQRLSTIKNAKKIMVLDRGRIIESGTYESLLEANGTFTRLLNIQKKVEDDSLKSVQSLLHKGIVQEEEEVYKEVEVIEKKNGETMGRIMSIMKKYWAWLVLALIASVISGLTFPLFGYMFSDNVTTMLGLIGSDIVADAKTNMYILIIEAVVILFSLTILCGALARISALYTYDLRYQGLNSLLYYDQKFYDKPDSSPPSLAYKLGSDCEKVSNIGGPVLGLQLLVVSSLTAGIIIAMQHNVVLSLVVIAMVPLIVVSNAKGELLQVNGLASNDLKKTSAIASDALTNIKTVHSFNRQVLFHEKYTEATQSENDNVMKSAHMNGFMFGFRYCVLYFVWGVIAWFGAYRVREGELDLDDMLIVFFCIMFSSWGFMVVGALIPDVDGGIDSAKKMFEIIDYQPEINANSNEGCVDPIHGNFTFKDVIFQYENRNIVVLKNINLTVTAGTTLGITGTTGSGKSTIAQLLLRFYDPTAGEIFLEGKPLKSYNIRHLRDSVCWVGQEPILFKGSIFFNMQIARQDVTREEAVAALTKAQALDVLEKYGLDSDVGLRGNRLSGGQKQRVAIARALVRKPKVLVFDESTSALDTITESNLQKAIKDEKFTIIAIAHRLKTIRDYDQIILIEKGSIVEVGTHDQLMKISNGYYKKLYQTSE